MSNNTENLTLLDLEAQLAETKEALRVLRLKLAPLQKECFALGEKLDEITQMRDTLLWNDSIDFDGPITDRELELVLKAEKGSRIAYLTANKICEKKLAIRSSGYNPETNQAFFQIALTNRNQSVTERTQKSIETLLPHLKSTKIKFRKSTKSFPSEITGKLFDILEKTLSDSGSHQIIGDDVTGLWYYFVTVYSSTEIYKCCNTLRECLDYVETNCYYNESDSAD